MKSHVASLLLVIALLLPSFSFFSLPTLAADDGGGATAEDDDALYVKEGLVGLFDAYDLQNGTVSLSDGRWYNRAGEGYLILSSPEAWHAKEGGGIGYELDGYESFCARMGQIGITIPISLIPEGDYTLEYAVKHDGLVDADGNDVYHSTEMNGSAYGLFNKKISAFAFGPLHFMQFLPSVESMAMSLYMRPMYSTNVSYEQTGFANCFSDVDGVKLLHTIQSYSMTFDHTDKATASMSYDHAVYVLYRNGADVFTMDNKTAVRQSARTYLDSRSGAFRLMYDFPGTVYTVRIYDRVLTEEERLQNYFADLCRARGVDVRLVSSLPEEELRTLVFCASFLHPDSGEERLSYLPLLVEHFTERSTLLASRAVSYLGIQSRLDAFGVRALFEMDRQILSLLEDKYDVAVGGITGLARTCDASALTVDVGLDGTLSCGMGEASLAYRTGEGLLFALDVTDGSFRFAASADVVGGSEEGRQKTELVFRAFVALTDDEGKTDIYYFNAEGECFGREDSLYGRGVSIGKAADYFLNRYDKDPVYAMRYATSETLRRSASYYSDSDRTYYPGVTAGAQYVLHVDEEAIPGGDGTEGAPFATLLQAYDRAKVLLREDGVSVTIRLSEGVHRVAQTLTLSGDGIGRDCYFTVTGEGATLSGNRLLSPSFTELGDGVYVADIGKGLDFRYLYVDGALADLAYEGYRRYAAAYADGAEQWQTGAITQDPASAAYRPCVYCEPSAFTGMTADEICGTELHMEVEWGYKIMHVSRVDFDDVDDEGRVAVYLEEGDFRGTVKTDISYSNRYYWFENSPAFVDTPGEFCYDEETGLLYYYPIEGSDIHSSIFEYPATERLLAFSDVENVTLMNFTVTGADNRFLERAGYYDGGQAGIRNDRSMPSISAVYGEDLSRFTAYGMRFDGLCADALHLTGGLSDIVIDSCDFRDIGASAVRIGDGDEEWRGDNCVIGCRIENNMVENAAWYLRSSSAIYLCIGRDVMIRHNTVRDCSYSAISVGWRWHEVSFEAGEDYHLYNVEISYNYLENYMTDMSDGGAIYTVGSNAERHYTGYMNRIHHNYAVENALTGAGKGRFMSMYHDGSSSHWHDYDNVVYTANPENSGLGAYYLQMGAGQTHNILVDRTYFIGAVYTDPTVVGGVLITGIDSEEEYIEKVLFYSHVRNDYAVYQQNSVCVESLDVAPDACLAIIAQAGARRDGK